MSGVAISWDRKGLCGILERYRGINISESSVYRILERHKLNRLPKTAPRRATHTKRYAKSVPGPSK